MFAEFARQIYSDGMKTHRFAIVLMVINFGLLVWLLSQTRLASVENANAVPAVLRGRSLEIVDEDGKIRATIKVLEPSAKLAKSMTILRLIDPNGRPEVKLFASVQGGGISFVGDADTTQVLLEAHGPQASLKLTNTDGKQQLVKP